MLTYQTNLETIDVSNEMINSYLDSEDEYVKKYGHSFFDSNSKISLFTDILK